MTDSVETEVVVVPVTTDELGRTVATSKFSFKVPDTHPEAGTKIEKSFDYVVCSDDKQAVATLSEKKWKITELVNERLKGSARSNAYQNALMPYKPSEVSPADIRARMIRDLIRSGVAEAIATTVIDTALATKEEVAA